MLSAELLGANQFGLALGRIGAASTTLAPVLGSMFVVAGAIALVDVVSTLVDRYEKWKQLGEQTVHWMNDLTLSLRASNDQLELQNLHLENQILKLDHKPENFMGIALAENKLKADELGKSLEDAFQKMVKVLEAGPGIGSLIFLQTGNVAAAGKLLAPYRDRLQTAMLTNDEEERNQVLLEAHSTLLKKYVEEQGTLQHLLPGDKGVFLNIRGQTPDPGTLNAYRSALAAVDEMMKKVNLDEVNALNQVTDAKKRQAAEALAAAQRREELESKANESMQRLAKKDLEEFEKNQARQLVDDRRDAEESKRMAREDLEEWKRAQAEKVRAAKAAAEDYIRTWRDAIKTEEETFRQGQKTSQLAMQDISVTTRVQTAGMGKGPISDVLQSEALSQQASVATAALAEARAAVEKYSLALESIAVAQGAIDRSTAAGLAEYEGLESKIEQLTHGYNSANDAAKQWANSLKLLASEQKALSPNLGTAMVNSFQAGFAAFNSGLVKMVAGGQSFTKTMQQLWTGMASTFIEAVLKMGEQWLVSHVLMIGIQKLFQAIGLGGAADEVANNKVKAVSAAGLAGANATASWALAPWPIDSFAPEFGAGVMAAAMGMAVAEKGGLVKGATGTATPILAHGGEMILPQNLSAFVQQSAAQSARGGTGAPPGSGNSPITVNLHSHTHVSTLSGDGMDEVLEAHSDRLWNHFRGRLRKFGYTA
jgi:hypothetical protein